MVYLVWIFLYAFWIHLKFDSCTVVCLFIYFFFCMTFILKIFTRLYQYRPSFFSFHPYRAVCWQIPYFCIFMTQIIKVEIFTMVSYFLRWTLLKIFSSIPDEQSQQKVRRLGRITCAVINTSNKVKCPLLWEFWINSFSRRILERVLVRNIVNIRNECLFFWVHGGMNRSAEQTNHSRTASRFTRFVCPALRFMPPWTQKKRHSFLN